jgi:hypothetical protein
MQATLAADQKESKSVLAVVTKNEQDLTGAGKPTVSYGLSETNFVKLSTVARREPYCLNCFVQ